MEQYDNKVDVFINKAPDFAKPILEYLREIIHETSPLLTETIKWGFPFFDYKGVVCQMGAFKEHCSFGFWKASLLNNPDGALIIGDGAAGNFGRITKIEDLPAKEILQGFIKQAMALNESGKKKTEAVKKVPTPKTELVVPEYFIRFLTAFPNANLNFDRFSYSQKKEYVEWILEAKTEATRQKRLETAAEWIAEGKSRHWKYK
ncbi:Uncharacterized conserved protein YdeI, YjbR/CyaY-like superfamily, DUF1801 family [Mucilaginibacter pineti]|uniref:Uncharacterized conserved protein YdeI, YjbR/CyaY-like superfamily, DUF1801 family n=1 Tax=Mucilaginibacter pineti TaxID=1391627 RepID=A0A1G7JAS1_9SPHI|nr:DUF1801 domain-containing protein [Mucilaginibacter pineti]SDF21973.1 Uncharacterized conserved protein YdeI, YjbR/CyaY-like superfamily, DUF1801 family [Mucilaginibacter pineti]